MAPLNREATRSRLDQRNGTAARKRRTRWMRAHPLCAECERNGIVRPGDEMDHVVPVEDGGADDESNFQTLCLDCHRAKTAREQASKPGWGMGTDGSGGRLPT